MHERYTATCRPHLCRGPVGFTRRGAIGGGQLRRLPGGGEAGPGVDATVAALLSPHVCDHGVAMGGLMTLNNFIMMGAAVAKHVVKSGAKKAVNSLADMYQQRQARLAHEKATDEWWKQAMQGMQAFPGTPSTPKPLYKCIVKIRSEF